MKKYEIPRPGSWTLIEPDDDFPWVDGTDGVVHMMSKVDGSLIAAAPDLYWAAKQLLASVNVYTDQGAMVMQQMEAAIAKAEGK